MRRRSFDIDLTETVRGHHSLGHTCWKWSYLRGIRYFCTTWSLQEGACGCSW